MSEATIARPYARALFNIAQADNAMAEWVEALDASAAMVEHPDFKNILGAPALTHSALIEMLSEASAKSGVSGEQLKNFMSQLVANQRVPLLPHIAERFKAFALGARGAQYAQISTALEVDEAQKNKILSFLQTQGAGELVANWRVDSSLIGGFRAQLDDKVYDFSLEQACKVCEKLVKVTD